MSWFKAGFEAGRNGSDASLPTDRGKYDGSSLLLDFMCPGLGAAMTYAESGGTKKDDEDYIRGYTAGALSRK